MKEITEEKLFELYTDTLQKCGIRLLEMNDESIGYYIFEEFDIGVVSFFHNDALTRLEQANFITETIVYKSSLLRKKLMKLQNTELWNIESVKHSKEWQDILIMSDEIKALL